MWAASSDYDRESFTLRLPAALSRLATYGDVAASGGASAASKWESSINPASCATQPRKGRRVNLSGQVVGIWFEEGTRFRLTSEAVTVDAGELGVFLPAIAQIRTNSTTGLSGLDFELEGSYYQLQWGKRVSETTAVGITLAYSRSESHFKLGSVDVTKADGPSYTARLGLLHEATEKVRVGLVCEYTRAPSTTIYYDFMGLGIGDRLEVLYRVPERDGSYASKALSLTLRGVVDLKGPAADPKLVPRFEGITDAETIDEWRPPFPIDLKRTTKLDDDYWRAYRATPKAFVSLEVARGIWQTGHSANWVTSVRIAPPAGRERLIHP